MPLPSTPTIELRIGDDETWVSVADPHPQPALRLAIGMRQLARDCLRHDPPRPVELEQAIAVVEDQVMPLARQLPAGAALHTTDAVLAGWASTLAGRDGVQGLSLEQVEAAFERLTALSLGRPRTQDTLPHGSAFAAYLLILREFMHHLQFAQIDIRRRAD